MSKQTPWDDIRTPSIDYNVRLVAGSDYIPLYWGRDAEGHCLFLVELDGDHSTQFRRDAIRIQGIRLDLRQGETEQQRLVLTLEKHIDQDLFSGLCESLVRTLTPMADSATALSVTLAHIKRWKAFLAGRKTRLLSPEEIRGLFAELWFLRSLYQSHLPEKAAVDAWCGVEGLHQDFIFGNTAVEIKSLSGKERNTVHISSEDQLEGISDNLFLMIFRLNDMPDSARALSLNDAVYRIENELTDASVIENFSAKLAGYGYVSIPEYDLPKLLVNATHAYLVSNNFPRLIRSCLPEGVTKVSYEIELENISLFEIEPEQIFRR